MLLQGELILCDDIVAAEAIAQNKDILSHYAHLILHGMLHLQGMDHINDADAVVMESLEIELMSKLGFANPYFVYTRTDWKYNDARSDEAYK